MILNLNKDEKIVVCSALDAYKAIAAKFMNTEEEQDVRICYFLTIEIIDRLKGKINTGENET